MPSDPKVKRAPTYKKRASVFVSREESTNMRKRIKDSISALEEKQREDEIRNLDLKAIQEEQDREDYGMN